MQKRLIILSHSQNRTSVVLHSVQFIVSHYVPPIHFLAEMTNEVDNKIQNVSQLLHENFNSLP